MNYTVEAVVGQNQWEGQHGPMVTYKLNLQEQEGIVETNRKPTSPAPAVGEVIEGTIEPAKGSFPPKLKKTPQQQGGGGGGFRPRDPAETAAIQRQHSQSVAVAYLAVEVSRGRVPETFGFDDFLMLVNRFDDDITMGARRRLEKS